jgi:hypothetical protein
MIAIEARWLSFRNVPLYKQYLMFRRQMILWGNAVGNQGRCWLRYGFMLILVLKSRSRDFAND